MGHLLPECVHVHPACQRCEQLDMYVCMDLHLDYFVFAIEGFSYLLPKYLFNSLQNHHLGCFALEGDGSLLMGGCQIID